MKDTSSQEAGERGKHKARRKRGGAEDENNCGGPGRKVGQLQVKTCVSVNGSCKTKVVIRFSSKGQSWKFA